MAEPGIANKDLPRDYAQIKEGFGPLLDNLDGSALAILEDAKEIAQVLGIQTVAPAHIALAKLMRDYQAELKKDAQEPLDFTGIIQKVSPSTTTFSAEPARTLRPADQTKDVILRAPKPVPPTPGQKIDRAAILVSVCDVDNSLTKALSQIPKGTFHNYRETVYEPRIKQVLDSLKPNPIFGQRSA